MAVKPQKDPRYKLINDKPRRYRDVVTGEIITRDEFEKRTKGTPVKAPLGARTGGTRHQEKTLGVQGNLGGSTGAEQPGAPVSETQMQEAPSGIEIGAPVPIAEVPEPPPLLSGLNQAANFGGDVAKAAGQKSSDSLANIVGEGLAMCLNLIADIKAAPDKRYLVVETSALAMVTKPAARIAARHLPVEIEAVGPDGQDAAELFKGIMYCVTAIWANKQVFDEEMRKREAEYAQLYDAHYGPGAYQRARAQGAGQTAGTGGPVPGPGSQGIISNGTPQPGTAGAAANGSGNHRGDGGRTAGLIHQLYQQYPGTAGQPPGFGRAV